MNSCPASTRRESMLTPVISMFESPARDGFQEIPTEEMQQLGLPEEWLKQK